MLMIPKMMEARPRNQISSCPNGKCQAWQWPCGYTPTNPLNDLTQIIWTGYPSKQSTKWNLVIRFTWPTKVAEYIIGLAIDNETNQKKPKSKYESWIHKPSVRVAIGNWKQIMTNKKYGLNSTSKITSK